MKSNKIQSALEYWRNRLIHEYGDYHIVNITLYGSQNYNIDTPNSDVDVKAIYVPTSFDAIMESKWLSKEHHNSSNEHCEIKDIREMFKMYQKANLNFLETLFTPYRWDNPKYQEVNEALKSRANDIAYKNMWYGIKSTCGQALNSINRLQKAHPDQDFKDDFKIIAKIIYLYIYLNKYMTRNDYNECLKITNDDRFWGFSARPLLIGLKTHDLTMFDPHDIGKFMKEIPDVLELLKEFFIENSEKTKPTDDTTNVWWFLRQTAYNTIFQCDKICKEG